MTPKFFPFLVLVLILASACVKDDDTITPESADYTPVLQNTAQNVILLTYQALESAGSDLQLATQVLDSSPTATNLESAKEAWVNARSPWEKSEGFLFGPVDQEGIDPAIDSWPVNVIDLNNVLGSSDELTVEFLAQQEGTLKGFHTIEFLLWGENGDKEVEDFTTREYEYLAAASGALANDVSELADLWSPTGGNYVGNIIEAGSGSIIYVSQKSALEEIVNSLIVIADEVANGKINDPLAQQDLTLEESRFSANSKADFSDNIRSIQNVYLGEYGTNGDGNSLSDIIEDKNGTLNNTVISEIEVAIQSIVEIEGTFSEAVFNNPDDVEAAQGAVRTLQATLEEEVLPIISNL